MTNEDVEALGLPFLTAKELKKRLEDLKRDLNSKVAKMAEELAQTPATGPSGGISAASCDGEGEREKEKQKMAHSLETSAPSASPLAGLTSAIRQGDVPGIIEAMEKHKEHAGVREQGCGALRNLAANNAKNKVMIAEAGGIISCIRFAVYLGR